jgi:hypothetical protein
MLGADRSLSLPIMATMKFSISVPLARVLFRFGLLYYILSSWPGHGLPKRLFNLLSRQRLFSFNSFANFDPDFPDDGWEMFMDMETEAAETAITETNEEFLLSGPVFVVENNQNPGAGAGAA